jgi:hypothetical protein
MPTVLRIDGYRFIMYLSDHEPPHVHIKSRELEAIFYLNCPMGPASLRKNFGFSQSEANHLRGLVQKNLAILCIKWKELHEN